MTKAMVFLSTRQLTQVDFSAPLFNDYNLIVIASAQELSQLPQSITEHFVQQFSIAIKANDGVIIEYEQKEIRGIVDSLTGSYADIDIICFDEGNIELADALRKNAAGRGNLERFRDKVTMKTCLSETAITTPRFLEVLDDKQGFRGIAEVLGSPFVVKPKRSAGSNNIYIVHNERDFVEVTDQVGTLFSEYEAEEYIDGDLYHCDIAVWQGESIFAECTEYLCPTIDFQTGSPLGGRVMDVDSSLRERLIAFAEKSLAVMQADDGVYHMEIFVRRNQSQELVFLEVGARPPGMLVTTMYENATGINLLNLDILIQTRMVPPGFRFSRQQYAFYLVYPKGAGRVVALKTPALYDANTLTMKFSNPSIIGEVHDGCRSNLDFSAYVTCSGREKSIIDQAFTQMSQFKPVTYAAG
ncbi:ATP-grasp domain-containing protein [Rosenbergiella epipactidis]|uniref:ATP-grasp domain-containing protein n=1 Tax=Rosenbergiella epipactidis TaxID=1544694 RepID=UPI000664526E|nr:biotin carboxylase [Rosenbergiella epipactidis]KMV67098.1 biotin carboxylase [bacteria symbiont BFo2 of Frankliniella occidentalis]KYP94575.1 biotin carboxylase [bacteria symbiont BFo2 of Frankliniella occidentalis]KYP96060.1 biotin carboxylase [bacteria symbiont BFo2 of Frankliniella occidentalis]